jgi:alpha-ketoglutarate-dependent taurine dioxygenase
MRGPPRVDDHAVVGDARVLDNPALADISNLGPGDRILSRDDRKRLFDLGNQLWHSDSSYKAIPARYSLLCAHVIPPEGGNTEFADMRAGYDGLDGTTKTLIEDLVCEHSRIFSKGALGFSFTEEELRAFAPVRQRRCARIAGPGAGRCICLRMPAASSAGRCRRRCCCCAS